MPVANVAKALFALQHAGLEGRMRITFELFDSDRSGRIDLQELYEILRVCCSSPFSFLWKIPKHVPAASASNATHHGLMAGAYGLAAIMQTPAQPSLTTPMSCKQCERAQLSQPAYMYWHARNGVLQSSKHARAG